MRKYLPGIIGLVIGFLICDYVEKYPTLGLIILYSFFLYFLWCGIISKNDMLIRISGAVTVFILHSPMIVDAINNETGASGLIVFLTVLVFLYPTFLWFCLAPLVINGGGKIIDQILKSFRNL